MNVTATLSKTSREFLYQLARYYMATQLLKMWQKMFQCQVVPLQNNVTL
jgi:hypothetical protein